jgi:hypothetical protein
LINKQEPRSGTGSSFKIFPPKQHLHESFRLLPVRGYDTSCGKSKSPAPLTVYGNLTTPRHENRKIRHENKLLKAKEPTPDV